jgi:hypothetical protein
MTARDDLLALIELWMPSPVGTKAKRTVSRIEAETREACAVIVDGFGSFCADAAAAIRKQEPKP